MKKLKLLLLLLPIFGISQEFKNGQFTKTVELKKSSDLIYQRAIEYVGETYQNPKEVIQLDTKTKVIFIGNVDYSILADNGVLLEYYLKQRISISIRDNKFKIDLIFGNLIAKDSPEIIVESRNTS